MESQAFLAAAQAMVRVSWEGAAIAMGGGVVWLTVLYLVIPWLARRHGWGRRG